MPNGSVVAAAVAVPVSGSPASPRIPVCLGRRDAARVPRHQHQPRRQGREGWPPVLLHRPRGDRRRQRPRRPRLRQGQGGAPRHPEGHREARKNLFKVALAGTTIIHPVIGETGAGRVFMKPAAPGTGVIAGGAARAILEEAGIRDVLCKSLGSSNHINVARATIQGLKALKRPDEIAKLRGLDPEEFVPKALLAAYRESERSGAGPEGRDGRPPGHAGPLGHRHQAQAPGHAPGAGARRIGKTNVLPDRPEIRGMIAKVPHLISVEEDEK